ncbi:MAG: tRNA preQ1(34) S-adenosylmethionine ribosyltransferase-isomerase QueA [Candidatus Goldbacteria bacterium]|nr:tRNA preQ1(34) S-adenosylmethionine ribosyltransferase-isomerase QueA [Candidatus Goldiibacteriota bacterium]
MENIYKLSFYDYKLDESLIAQKPLKKRDESRLLVLCKDTGKIIHDRFYNIGNYLKKDDLLILNNTRVIPARLFGEKEKTKAKIEILLLDFLNDKAVEVMMRNSRRLNVNDIISFPGGLKGKLINKKGKTVILEFNFKKEKVLDIFKKYGAMPLPPYIKEEKDNPFHRKTYQTVYSKIEGSKAAPTAGFHFTKQLIKKLKNDGIKFTEITLHVGLGTFEPVLSDDIREHKMHAEFFEMNNKTATLINMTRNNGNKIIAVGTTSLRTIESCVEGDMVISKKQWTSLFIYPGYKFKITDGLITNFHLPKTTLFMLVCAFGGIENVKKAYKEAIKEKYRFYSYGDAMLII